MAKITRIIFSLPLLMIAIVVMYWLLDTLVESYWPNMARFWFGVIQSFLQVALVFLWVIIFVGWKK